jgi:hypothetical protein
MLMVLPIMIIGMNEGLKRVIGMKTTRVILSIAMIAITATMAFSQRSFRKSEVSPSLMTCPSVYPFNIGVKGGILDNYMIYSALSTAQNHFLFSIDGGVTVEWECQPFFSMGLDVMYASRGTRKSFKTEFLVNYSTSDYAYYDYSAKLRGIEVFFPLTFYREIRFPEDLTFIRNNVSKLYLFVGPELYLPMSGHMDWKRYYGDGTIYKEYHIEATKASVRDFYYGFGLGIGFWHKDYHTFFPRNKKRSVSTFFISKVDFSCFIESNTLSKPEMDEVVENVYGWGDLEHETLGKRYGLVFKVTGTFLLPIRHKPSDSCYGIGTKVIYNKSKR